MSRSCELDTMLQVVLQVDELSLNGYFNFFSLLASTAYQALILAAEAGMIKSKHPYLTGLDKGSRLAF